MPSMYRWKGKWVSEKVYNSKIQKSGKLKTYWKNRSATVEDVNEDENEAILKAQEIITEAKIVMGEKGIIRLPEIETERENKIQDDEGSDVDAEESAQENGIVEGRRIVDLSELAKQLWCITCKEALSLSKIEKECRRGYGSMLLIRCHKCLVGNEVFTSTTYFAKDSSRAQRFDINKDFALALQNSKISLGLWNKIHTYFKLPTIKYSTHKKYHEEIKVVTDKARRTNSPILEDQA